MLHFGKQGLSIAATAAVSAAVKASDKLHDCVCVRALVRYSSSLGVFCVNVSGVSVGVRVCRPLFCRFGFGSISYACRVAP